MIERTLDRHVLCISSKDKALSKCSIADSHYGLLPGVKRRMKNYSVRLPDGNLFACAFEGQTVL